MFSYRVCLLHIDKENIILNELNILGYLISNEIHAQQSQVSIFFKFSLVL